MSKGSHPGARPRSRSQPSRRLAPAQSSEIRSERRNSTQHRSSPFPSALVPAILESALDCIVTIDSHGVVLEFNPAAERTFGYRRDEVLGKELAQCIIPPDLRERHRAGLAHYLATGEGRVVRRRVEIMAMRADGSEFLVELAITPIESDGAPVFVAYLRDISERKQAEAERMRLHELESAARAEAEHQARQLRAVFEAMTDGVIVYDRQGRVVHTNTALRGVLGAGSNLNEYLALPIQQRLRQLDMRDRDGRPFAEDQYPQLRLLAGEAITTADAVELTQRGLDGTDRRVMITGGPLRGDRGELAGAVCVYRDVSSRRSLERELAERVGVLEATYEAMVDGVATYDADGRIISVNPALRNLVGIDARPEYEGLPLSERITWLSLYDMRGRPLVVEEWPPARVLRGDVLVGERAMEIVAHTLDGRQTELSVTGAPVYNTAGQIAGAVCLYRDVVARRVIERQTLAALHALMRCADVVTTHTARETDADLLGRLATCLLDLEAADFTHAMLLDEQGHLTPVGIYGVTAEQERVWREGIADFDPTRLPQLSEVLAFLSTGRPLLQHFDADQPLVSMRTVHALQVRAAITGPVIVNGRVIGLLTISRSRPLESGVTSLFAPWDVDLVADVGRLAGQALMQAQLGEQLTLAEAARLAAEAAARQRDEFLSVASHELKTPVTSLKLNLQLAQRRMSSARTKESASSVESLLSALLPRTNDQVDRLTRLIDDLLDVSRIETDKLALRLESCDLVALVENVVGEQRQHHPNRSIVLHQQSDPPQLCADADRIAQVLINYLTNAVKYSPDNAPVEVTVEREERVARVVVRDYGLGLPPEERQRIWERFYRAPNIEVQSGSGIGLGLGLFISKSIVERHGGEVGVESVPGEGSRFWFTLPLQDTDAPRDTAPDAR